MKNFLPLIALFSVLSACNASKDNEKTLDKGWYTLSLDLGAKKLQVPVEIKNNTLEIWNASENITLNFQKDGDTLTANFPVFDTGLKLVISGKNKAAGQWIKFYKKDYQLPASLEKRETSFSPSKNDNFTNYEIAFSPNTDDFYPALGRFYTYNKNDITGTFATETGDYRFLNGTVTNNQFQLNTFDGSHAFVFTGTFKNDSIINGIFYSGNHWKEPYKGVKNLTFSLANPDSISKNNNPVTFSFLSEDSTIYTFDNQTFKDTAVIIQILGTWCPNCMDETYFLSDLQEKYKDQALKIIGISFETKTDFSYYKKQIAKLKKTTGIKYPILLGGKASKKVASDTLTFIDEIKSFPTTIFLDKNHNVKRVHTGFYGPGTGSYYDKFTEETYQLLDKILAE